MITTTNREKQSPENATHRANAGSAQVGTVASAVRFLAKGILTGNPALKNSSEQEALRGHLTGERGIGRAVIVEFLKGIPGINDGTVQQQIANLKASGNYARIIRARAGLTDALFLVTGSRASALPGKGALGRALASPGLLPLTKGGTLKVNAQSSSNRGSMACQPTVSCALSGYRLRGATPA